MLRLMGIAAPGTVLHQLPFLILKIHRLAQTVLQTVHGTITKEAVKILPLHILMAWKILTCRIAEKTITVLHFISLY